MTDLNSTNLKEIITSTLQEFLVEHSLLTNAPILLWTNSNPKYPNSFILRIDNQKLLGLERKDKRGETYWKFKLRKESETKEPDDQSEENSLQSSPAMDPIAKYQERLNQTQELNNHDQSKSVNS